LNVSDDSSSVELETTSDKEAKTLVDPMKNLVLSSTGTGEEKNENGVFGDAHQVTESKLKNKTQSFIPTDEKDRKARLEEQMKLSSWNDVVKSNLILKQGLVSKRKVSNAQ